MRELLTELVASAESGRPCVYCSVVETRGSTPQKAGAAMLVFADGSQRGTLGGGCVEAEVKERALRVLNGTNPSSEILTFLLDDNYGWDDGLICGGRMTILADPVLASRRTYYQSLLGLAEAGEGFTEAIVVKAESTEPPIGSRFLFGPDGSIVGQTTAGTVPEAVRSLLVPLARRPECAVAKGIAYLPVLPRVTLLIVGGGHVGQAVARLASDVDFDVWVVDDRQTYASRERFSTAERLIVGDIGQTLEKLVRDGIGKSTYCLIVTRGHAHDEEALYHLANTAAGYVGMIGSKRKIQLIYEDLRAKGVSAEALARVHAPLGLRIGSRTVPEIAVSIVAELIACRNMPGDRNRQESPS
jgi:xanthine dehydrogenase accessory factor